MKMRLHHLLAGLAGVLSIGVFNAAARLEVSGSIQISASTDFYAPLATHGSWVEVGSYGRCWRPASVAVEWRPYCHGHWVWTDCGWYWESDEPWAWACYHYGYWAYDSSYGWLWIPGTDWAPAWVEWRVGGGYLGWAPCGPRGVVVASVGVGFSPFVFVEAGRFHERVRPSTVIVNNTTIINKTTVINNIRQETKTFSGAKSQRVMVNEGPGVAMVQKATGQKVRTASIHEVARQTRAPAELQRSTVESNPKGKPAVTQEPSKPALDYKNKIAPHEVAPRVEKPLAPHKGGPLPREEVVPPRTGPPTQRVAPERPSQPSAGKGEPKPKGKKPQDDDSESSPDRSHGKGHGRDKP